MQVGRLWLPDLSANCAKRLYKCGKICYNNHGGGKIKYGSTFLIRLPDENGVERKTILFRTITVEQ